MSSHSAVPLWAFRERRYKDRNFIPKYIRFWKESDDCYLFLTHRNTKRLCGLLIYGTPSCGPSART